MPIDATRAWLSGSDEVEVTDVDTAGAGADTGSLFGGPTPQDGCAGSDSARTLSTIEPDDIRPRRRAHRRSDEGRSDRGHVGSFVHDAGHGPGRRRSIGIRPSGDAAPRPAFARYRAAGSTERCRQRRRARPRTHRKVGSEGNGGRRRSTGMARRCRRTAGEETALMSVPVGLDDARPECRLLCSRRAVLADPQARRRPRHS